MAEDLQEQISEMLRAIDEKRSPAAFAFFLENNIYQYYEHLLRTEPFGLTEDHFAIMQVKLQLIEICHQRHLVACEELQSALRDILVQTQSYLRNGRDKTILEVVKTMHATGVELLTRL